jgi:RimJ/RimL family protein N-acetyltransferase
MLNIETERTLIRKFRETDIPDIIELSKKADFWLERNIGWEPTEKDIKDYFAKQRDIYPKMQPEWVDLAVELKSTGRVIGFVGIGVKDPVNRQAIIGWLLGTKYQGRGLATEAVRALITYGFDEMSLHRIYARTGLKNTRSWKLMERLGMRREAHFKKSHTVSEEWDDEVIYAVLEEEWDSEG